MKNTIGLMMVVRNEVHRMKEFLDWHMPYVDQAAICDQSSDDGTYELIDGYFAHLYKDIECHLWKEKPMGFCEPCKQPTADLLDTEWLLYLDPDEKLSKAFLEEMHQWVKTPDFDGFRFERDNYFDIQFFNDQVPIEPKRMIVKHPTRDPQVRLTRKSVSVFPPDLHNRVRVKRKDGKEYIQNVPFAIEHTKTLTEQWNDNKRYTETMEKLRSVK